MEVVRKVINSDLLLNIVDIPENLRNKKVEILIRPLATEKSLEKNKLPVKGMLEKYKNIEMLGREAEAWPEAVREKYDDN